jgi:hypothetical protein
MYQGFTPRQAQAYLTKVWARIRARLKYYELPVYGFRIAEPHADGCPHWHMLLFMNKADMKQINQIMRTYALAEEGQEKGARIHRFKVVKIDAKKGSATGYIVKYVSKNIDGFGLDEDFESGTQANDSASRVRAWASLWGIRQFQQIGGAPVGVWRELRRIDSLQEDTPYTLQKAYQAADGGDWDRYLSAQGGVINPRKDQPLKLYTLEKYDKSTGEVHTNKYGERVAKVQGISLWANPVIKTRVHTWRIERKVQDMSTLMSTPQAITYKPDFDLMGQVLQTFAPTSDGSSLSSESALSAPWSTGNNCTFSDLEHESRYEAQQERAAILLYNLEYEELERVKQVKNSAVEV